MTASQPEPMLRQKARSGAINFNNSGNIGGPVIFGGHPPTGDYRRDVCRQSAVDDLPDRQDELDELREFCSGDEDYVWWQGAVWAGKTTLMARFMKDPGLDDVVTVGFFITPTGLDQCNRFAFAAALVEQLCEELGEALPPLRTDNADRQLRTLLERTAEHLGKKKPSKRLVLVVDGLDEDRSEGAGIAGLLPTWPIPGLKVVVSSRPLSRVPTDDKGADHPLLSRCRVRALSRTERAGDVEKASTAEVEWALRGGGGVAEDVLGLIAASGGGLSCDDLQAMITVPPYQLDQLLNSAFGRSLTLRTVRQAAIDARPAQIYVFRHEALREKTKEKLGAAAMDTYQDTIHCWARGEWEKGWSAASPAYLLYTYPYLLRAEGNLNLLLDLVSDPGRRQHMLAVSHAVATAEVTMALDAAAQRLDQLEHSDGTVLAAARLAAHRAELVHRAPATPVNLPALWVMLGDVHHAETLLRTVTGSDRQAKARQLTAEALAVRPQLEDEETRAIAAAPVPTPATARHPVEDLVFAGKVDEAVALVADTTDQQRHLESMIMLVKAMVRADEPYRAWELAVTHRVKNRFRLQAAVVQEVARQGNVDLARKWAGEIKDPERKGRLWMELIPDIRAAFGVAAVAAIPKKIKPSHHKAMAQIEVACIAALAGDLQRARAMAANAEETAAQINGPNREQWLVTVQGGLVRAYSATGELDRAEAIWGRIGHPARAARALIEDLAPAAYAAGDISRIERIEEALSEAFAEQTSADRQAGSLIVLALAMATRGDASRAREMIEQVDDATLRRYAQVELALRLAPADEAAARQIAAAMDAPDDDVSATHVQSRAVVQTALARERPDDADVPFADAEAAARGIEDGYGRATSLSQVAKALAKYGYWRRALAVAYSIDHPYYQAATLLQLVEPLPPCDPQRAGLLADAERAVQQVSDPRWQATAIAGLVRALAGHAKTSVLDRHLAAGRQALRTKWDQREQGLAHAELMAAASTAGRFGSVCTMADKIDNVVERISALLQAADAADTGGHAKQAARFGQQAEALLAKLDGPEQRVRVQARMVKRYAAMGRDAKARALVGRIAQDVAKITDPALHGAAQADHVAAVLACGDRPEAQCLAVRIVHPYWQCQALSAVVRSLVGNREFDEAERVCGLTDDAAKMTRSLLHLALAAAEHEDAERAKRITASISDPAQRAEVLAKLARSQPRRSTAARRLTVAALASASNWTDVLPAVLYASPPTAHLVIGEYAAAGRNTDGGSGGPDQPPQ